jgi:hypothetical protein
VFEARAGVLTDVELSHVSIWGTDAIASSLWELTPFSFILDWFFNVGQKIAAFSPNAGVRKLASWVTVRTLATLTNSADGFSNVVVCDYADSMSWSGVKTRTESWTTRTPNPTMRLLPSVKIRLDNLKLLDLGIILNKMR